MKKILLIGLLFLLAFSIHVDAISYPGNYSICSLYDSRYNTWNLQCLFKQYVAYQETGISPQQLCANPDKINNIVECRISGSNDFWTGGLNAVDGVGVNRISELWGNGLIYFTPNQELIILKINKCKFSGVISGGMCNGGTCYPGCGLNGGCNPLTPCNTLSLNVEGTVSGNACVWKAVDYKPNPGTDCNGEISGNYPINRGPGVDGTLTFYYEKPCEPNWTCNEWSSCINGQQTKLCNDGCNNTKTEEQTCEIIVEPPLPEENETEGKCWNYIDGCKSVACGTGRYDSEQECESANQIIIITPVCVWYNPFTWSACIGNALDSVVYLLSFRWIFG